MVLLERLGIFLLDRVAALERLAGFVDVLGVRGPRAPTALASAALKALMKSSAVARIACSSAASGGGLLLLGGLHGGKVADRRHGGQWQAYRDVSGNSARHGWFSECAPVVAGANGGGN